MQTLDRGSRFQEIFLEQLRPYAWIIGVGALLYFKSIFFDFCYFDDQELIVQNGAFLSNISNIFQAFCMKVYPKILATPYYRPLLIVSFILDAQVGGIFPFIYHLTNVAIHLAVSSLVFGLFVQLGCRKGVALFFAMVFAVHPALTQAVAWVPGRNDSMLAAFAIASFIAFLKFIASESRKAYIWHLIFLLLAVFTKESALILVAMCYLYLLLFREKGQKARVDLLMLAAGHITVCAIWFIPRYFVTRGSDPVTLFDIWNLIIPQLPAILQLIGKAVLPVHQSVFPTMRESPCVFGIASAALITALAVFSRKGSRRLIFFGAAWLMFFLVPPLIRSHAPVINDVLEHRLYLPIIGLMIILMELDLVKNGSAFKRKILAVAGIVILCLLFGKAFIYLDNFRNAEAFWENAVGGSPRSTFAHLKLGEVYYKHDRLDEAEVQIRQAMRLDFFSRYAGHYYLGHIYLKKGAVREAEKEFQKTLALIPNNDWAYMSLGVLYYKAGRYGEAERMWKRSLEENADNAESAKTLAIYYAEKKDFAAARYYVAWLRRLGVEAPKDFLKTIGEK